MVWKDFLLTPWKWKNISAYTLKHYNANLRKMWPRARLSRGRRYWHNSTLCLILHTFLPTNLHSDWRRFWQKGSTWCSRMRLWRNVNTAPTHTHTRTWERNGRLRSLIVLQSKDISPAVSFAKCPWVRMDPNSVHAFVWMLLWMWLWNLQLSQDPCPIHLLKIKTPWRETDVSRLQLAGWCVSCDWRVTPVGAGRDHHAPVTLIIRLLGLFYILLFYRTFFHEV